MHDINTTLPIEKEFERMEQISNDSSYQLLYIEENHYNKIFSDKSTIDRTFPSYYEAAYFLQSLPAGSKKLPEAIIDCYSEKRINKTIRFSKFLENNPNLNTIPFLLVESRKLNKGMKVSKPIPGIDDIVYDDITPDALKKKILFLKKFKILKRNRNKFLGTDKKYIPRERSILYRIDPYIKRAMDIIIASLALVLLSPILLLIAIIIKLESRGPIFYNAYRAGYGYHIFKFYKFRSMVVNADNKLGELKCKNQYADAASEGPVFFKVANDPRVTAFGSFLRNTSLDELPQLLNVLKGDMSLVGNRPLPLYEAAALTTDNYVERFIAPAGITGLWQINKRGKAEMSVSERVGQDITYARKHSFWLDLRIMLRTPRSLIQKEKV